MATPSLFNVDGSEDIAANWLGLLSGNAPAAALGPQAGLALSSLKDAFGIYGTAMLVVGGFLLIYHLVAIIADSAQTGVPLGRRASLLWTPLRFVVAIGLLVPIAGGLSSGQYLILTIAQQGSAMASTAWRAVAEPMKRLAAPMPVLLAPDTSRLVYGALEMEICRALYARYREGLKDLPLYNLVAPINDITKIPPQRLAPEVWQYSNNIEPDLPLCGSYRLPPLARLAPGNTGQEALKVANDKADFARASVERVILQTRLMGEQLAPLFYKSRERTDVSAAASLASLQADLRKSLVAKLNETLPNEKGRIDAALMQAAARGWIAAGTVLPLLSDSQWRYGQLAQHIVAEATPPLFGRAVLDPERLARDLVAHPVLRELPTVELNRIQAFYMAMNHDMRAVRAWLYSDTNDKALLVPPDAMDLQDALARPGTADSSLFAGVIDSIAISNNLWNQAGPAGTPFARFWVTELNQNPLILMAAYGQAMTQTADALLAMAGSAFGGTALVAHGVVLFIASTMLLIVGLGLLFLLPFLPLLRLAVGVVIWLLNIVEALLAMPLIALAHLSLAGEGLAGPIARRAYWLWLALFMRPALLLLGLVVGVPLFAMSLLVINALFLELTSGFAAEWGDGLAYLRLGFVMLYGVLVYGTLNLSFKGITLFPELALRWLGQMLTVEQSAAAYASPSTGASNQQSILAQLPAYFGSKGDKAAPAPSSPAAHFVMPLERPIPTATAESQGKVSVTPPPPESRAAERPASVQVSADHVSVTAQSVQAHSSQILDDKGIERAKARYPLPPDYAKLANAVSDLADRLDKVAPAKDDKEDQSKDEKAEDTAPASPPKKPPTNL